jgi:hypothetical protein
MFNAQNQETVYTVIRSRGPYTTIRYRIYAVRGNQGFVQDLSAPINITIMMFHSVTDCNRMQLTVIDCNLV